MLRYELSTLVRSLLSSDPDPQIHLYYAASPPPKTTAMTTGTTHGKTAWLPDDLSPARNPVLLGSPTSTRHPPPSVAGKLSCSSGRRRRQGVCAEMKENWKSGARRRRIRRGRNRRNKMGGVMVGLRWRREEDYRLKKQKFMAGLWMIFDSPNNDTE
ncbi:hypothetical protein Cgig2_024836 [Carnegiea gigantea]|uniref:Uncharacterized protein n=1 Tax=Carnegiea gigantea TaxID=171969 RepID=A0A9Q1KEA2_9CARY|nr:hypothetical protein Cgig2_024836 [Carnegiea gigantea]